MMAVDLLGFDARSIVPTAYFHVQESTISWGDQVHLNFVIWNQGDTSSPQSFNVGIYLSSDSTITAR